MSTSGSTILTLFETLCQHVVQKHHAKRLFMMAGVRDNTFSDERIHAFEKVMAENNITPDNYRIGYGDFWEKADERNPGTMVHRGTVCHSGRHHLRQ